MRHKPPLLLESAELPFLPSASNELLQVIIFMIFFISDKLS